MLKVFQRIRRRLLDEGKLKNYLVYALGEILLVVTGILIALQVNNWNEAQQLRSEEISLYSEILAELTETKKELIFDIEGLARNLKNTTKVRDLLVLRDRSEDSIRYYLPQVYNQKHFNPKTSAFESLKSTGLNLLSNDSVRIAITDLYQLDFPFLLSSSAQLEHLKFPDIFLPMLKKHLIIDRNTIRSDISNKKLMIRRRYFPYQIKDLDTLFEDEQLIIEIQASLDWRSARLRQFRGLLQKVERVESMIKTELLNLS